MGSGISLFITTNVAENIIWKCFSPITIRLRGQTEFEGIFIAMFHKMFTSKSTSKAFFDLMFRQGVPNLNNLLATILIFFIVIYFQGFKVLIKIKSMKNTGYQTTHPIKLFYTSNIPIILQTALISNVYFFSRILSRKFHGN